MLQTSFVVLIIELYVLTNTENSSAIKYTHN